MTPATNHAPSRTLGRAAVVAQVAGAILIAMVASAAGANGGFRPPEPISRSVVLGGLFLVPAVIGALGLAGERQAIVAAAGFVAMVDAVLSFSGVTFVFLVPAVMLVASAVGAFERVPATRPAGRVMRGRLSWRLLGLMAAVPLAIIAVLALGVLAVPLFGAFALIVGARRGASGARPWTIRRAMAPVGVGAIVVALAVASIAALFALTTAECWTAYRTSTGIRYDVRPWPAGGMGGMGGTGEIGGTGELQAADGAIAAGCANGIISPTGLAAAGVLALAAIGVSAVASRRGPVRTAA